MEGSNTSAVLDIVVESKEISSLLREQQHKDCDGSSVCSGSIENSLVQSPSLESFSTIHDLETMSELNMDENSDLSVKVDNPQKFLETLETYITFRITTKVARIEYSENEYVVRRRYNDFIWLRQKLLESHPFCIVPPLPGKHSLIGQLDRYSKDFILVRMKALNVFVSRVVNHPILSCNEHFKIFLTAKQTEFMQHRRQRTCNDPQIQNLSHSSSTHSVLKTRHLEFDKTKTYLTSLAEKLVSIERISSRINKERLEFCGELNSYHPVFTTWATSEPQLAPLLQGIGGALERNMSAQSALCLTYPTVIAAPIRNFVAYIDVVQETIKKRDSYQLTYEESVEELSKRHVEKDKLVTSSHGNHSNSIGSGSSSFSLWKQPSTDEKLEKLGVCIPQLLKKVEAAQDSLECANESLRSDLQHWQLEKQQCLKNILLGFVNKQIDYYQTCVNAWEHATDEIVPPNNFK